MDKAVLVNEQIDAGREFAEAFNACWAVDVLFWLNPADSSEWLLYIASHAINDGNLEDSAYKTGLEAADEIARELMLRELGGLTVIDLIDIIDGWS